MSRDMGGEMNCGSRSGAIGGEAAKLPSIGKVQTQQGGNPDVNQRVGTLTYFCFDTFPNSIVTLYVLSSI